MLALLIIITFIALILLTFSRDSLLNREYNIYNQLAKRPYLVRDFIKTTYFTFT
uniref:Uncharacterized protein n=1 Tax=Faxonius propinquus nudivirus TaxID=3139431 RepID=A0AAU8GD42_9VIRU